MDHFDVLSVKRLDPGYIRCFLVAAFLGLLCAGLALAHLWRNWAGPEGELFNKHEWSLVQELESEWRDSPAAVVTIPNALDSPDYDAIVLPRLDGQGSVVILSNAIGIPRIKAFFGGPLRYICLADYKRITTSMRLNAEVETLLKALTADCGN